MAIETRGIEVPDGSGAVLWIGVQPGQTRPTMWLTHPKNGNKPITLASFHGDLMAEAAWAAIDKWTDATAEVQGHLAHTVEHLTTFTSPNPTHDASQN